MRRASRTRILTFAALFLSFGGITFAADEEAPREPKERPKEATESAPAKAGRKAGDVELNEVEIRGELEKPKLFFILPKAEREIDTKERRLRFYPDILEPLDKDRFEEEARVLYQHGIPAE